MSVEDLARQNNEAFELYDESQKLPINNRAGRLADRTFKQKVFPAILSLSRLSCYCPRFVLLSLLRCG